jgi:putative PIG3 family NAD(P)H quinone oxidoreductase
MTSGERLMKAIRVENAGAQYRLTVQDLPRPVPGPREVLIKVAAAGLNRADIAQAMGRYPPPPGASDTLGMEVSGDVVELGSDVTDFKIGQSVCALLPGGGYAEYATASTLCVLPIPPSVELMAAAGLPEVHFTVWTNMMDSARLRSDESVLVHGGSSGIGTAAIQLCAARGHSVYATAGSADKCRACEQLGARKAINYREEDFVEAIRLATHDKGVDVILDMVGGEYIERNFRVLGRGGRLVNIAFQSGMTANVNFGLMLMKRLTFMATTLRARSNEEKGAIRDALLREVWPLVSAGRIKPVVDRVCPFEKAQEAHARMAESAHIGKILLAF